MTVGTVSWLASPLKRVSETSNNLRCLKSAVVRLAYLAMITSGRHILLPLCRLCTGLRCASALERWREIDPGCIRSLTTSLLVPDDKLEPLGHVKAELSERHVDQERKHLVTELPPEWFSRHISPAQRRERMVIRLADWTRRHCVTPTLLAKIMQGPLSEQELKKYTTNQIGRIVYAVGVMKKSNQFTGHPDRLAALVQSVLQEAGRTLRLVTYDGLGLSQAAYGVALMKLEDSSILNLFAKEVIKPYRLRNMAPKSLISFLDALREADFTGEKGYINTISEGAVASVVHLPNYSLPKILEVWGHYRYKNLDHVRAVLAEILKERRLNVLVAGQVEEILVACAKLNFNEPKVITCITRELIYSQKWRFMSPNALPRIVRALGDIQYSDARHWKIILSAAMDPDRASLMESNHVVDLYMGWGKVTFRHSRLLEALGEAMIKESRLREYSTRQLFEIFKAQKLLGQVESSYAGPVLEKLRDPEKLMKCNLETKMKLFLFPGIKKRLGMKCVASLAKGVFQKVCLERWDNRVLFTLSRALVPLGPIFGVCFGITAQELIQTDRLQKLTNEELCELLSVWNRLEFVDDEMLNQLIAECAQDQRLRSFSEQHLLMIVWLVSEGSGSNFDRGALEPLFREILSRSLTSFSPKGLMMILKSALMAKCLDKAALQPFVSEILKEEKQSQLKDDHRNTLSTILLELGFENEQKTLENT